MNEIDEKAYMNGYNWEAFFNYYLSKHAPDVLEEMDTDSEAGTYVACYPLTAKNEARADKFIGIINNLVENEEELYRIVREEGDKIELTNGKKVTRLQRRSKPPHTAQNCSAP